jgi:hypothetical protein
MQGLKIQALDYQLGKNLDERTWIAPDGQYYFSLSSDELILEALDVPPQQSRSRYLGILVSWGQQEQPSEDWRFPLCIYALDTNGKELARCEIAMTLTELKTLGIHKFPRLVLLPA